MRKINKALVIAMVFAISTTSFAIKSQPSSPLSPLKDRAKSDHDLFKKMNKGWPRFYQTLEPYLDSQKDYLWIKLKVPKYPIDVRSGEQFRQSTAAKAPLWRGELGHTMIMWQCHQPDGSVRKGITGMTGESENQNRQMALGGWGLTALLTMFNDGRLETYDDKVDDGIDGLEPFMSYNLVMEVDRKACNDAVGFIWKFISHPNNPKTLFGLYGKPKDFAGGGCGSFAWTAFEESGALPKTLFTDVWRKVYIPLALLGRGPELPSIRTTASINFRSGARELQESLYVSPSFLKYGPWDDTQRPAEVLDFIDPELMIFEVNAFMHEHLKTLPENSPEVQLFKSRYPDYRIVSHWVPDVGYDPPFHTPQYFLSTPIDENFDEHTEAIAKSVREWWQEKTARGMHAQLVPFGKMSSALILTNL